jgi:hypothetical protein
MTNATDSNPGKKGSVDSSWTDTSGTLNSMNPSRKISKKSSAIDSKAKKEDLHLSGQNAILGFAEDLKKGLTAASKSIPCILSHQIRGGNPVQIRWRNSRPVSGEHLFDRTGKRKLCKNTVPDQCLFVPLRKIGVYTHRCLSNHPRRECGQTGQQVSRSLRQTSGCQIQGRHRFDRTPPA